MTFHNGSWALLESRDFSKTVDKAQSPIRPDLPASVREWYSDPRLLTILKVFSNHDRALDPAEFVLRQTRDVKSMCFLVENQNVCDWSFAVDQGDDPPVFVTYAESGPEPTPCCKSFSQFVYTRIFDNGHALGHECSLEEVQPSVGAAVRQYLQATLQTEPVTTGWPSPETLRFSCPDGRLIIWNGERQSDWLMTSPTSAGLALMQRALLPLAKGDA